MLPGSLAGKHTKYIIIYIPQLLLPVTPNDVPEPCCVPLCRRRRGEGGKKEAKNIIMGARKKMVIVIIHKNQGGRSCAEAWGPPPKSLDSHENFKPEHTLFCRKLIFVAIYALFGDLWAKRSAFLGQKQCFLGKKCTITWYILHFLLS